MSQRRASDYPQCIQTMTGELKHLLDQHFATFNRKRFTDTLAEEGEAASHAGALYETIRGLHDKNAPERVAVRKVSTHKTVQVQALTAAVCLYALQRLEGGPSIDDVIRTLPSNVRPVQVGAYA